MMFDDLSEWLPLAVGILGLLGGLGGVLITQRRSDKRETVAWERERERWSREDAARTFDRRRDAYADFLREVYRVTILVLRRSGRTEQSELDAVIDDWFVNRPGQSDVQLYGPSAVFNLSLQLVESLVAWYNEIDARQPPDYEISEAEVSHQRASTMLFAQLAKAFREDLGITVPRQAGV